MTYKFVNDPCRNFCILASITLIDPIDRHEKIDLSSFVEGGTGILVFIDRNTGEGETVTLPGDEGAWALLNVNNEKLLVGTCGLLGYLHKLDLKTRTWSEPLRDKDETYIWNLVMGSDGKVYGGTWPGGVMLQYDIEGHTLKNLGRMSDVEENMYVREVYSGVPGYVLFSCGTAEQHLGAWNIETGERMRIGKSGAKISEITDEYIRTVNGDKFEYYDAKTFKDIEKTDVKEDKAGIGKAKLIPSGSRFVVELADGSLAGVKGQEYFIIDRDCIKPELKRIPVEAPATQILTITSDERGRIWGSSAFGQTIFSYNPPDNTYINTPSVCESGGEVYGMRFTGNRLFMSSYAGGDHVVYDPSKPWDQINNANPQTLKSVAPEFIRPTGRSIIGPDGAFWTGWSAKYGIYGGCLSRVDTGTLLVEAWNDPVPGQQIAWLAADDRYIFFITNGEASGRKTKVERFHMVKWDPYGRSIVKDILLPDGIVPGMISTVQNCTLVVAGEKILVFEKDAMNYVDTIALPEKCNVLTVLSDSEVLVFCDTKLFLIGMPKTEIIYRGELPGHVLSAAVTPEGDVYFAHKEHLYKLY
ncbi:MAG: hypothetical protein ABFD25_08730 [Clostridiaceae bacterium]